MILALDCATKTGWCLYDQGKVVESGVQDFSKKRGDSNGLMFLRFRNWLAGILDMNTPDIVVYEQAHHRGGAATEICVNLTGRVQEMCAGRDIEYTSYHTGTIKKRACGNGNASKQDMIDQAWSLLNRKPVDDNEADAVCLAMVAWEDYGRVK